MSCKRLFEEKYDVIIPRDFEVHHIDLNHFNNDLSNLMILPKILHRKYHESYRCFKVIESYFFKKFNFFISTSEIGPDVYAIEAVKSIISAIENCRMWANYKAYLDGKIWNIHGIKLYRKSNPDLVR